MRFSRHAKNRMRGFDLTRAGVDAIVDHFDDERADDDGNRVLTGRDEDDEAVTVVLALDDPNFVITLWRP